MSVMAGTFSSLGIGDNVLVGPNLDCSWVFEAGGANRTSVTCEYIAG